MKTFTVLISFLFLFSQLTWCGTTGKISGKVVDAQTGEPLLGANITIENTNLGAATLEDGSYYILNIPPGTYKVKASYIGYETMVVEKVIVNIDRTTYLNFKLTPQGVQSKTVVVTAKREGIIKDLTATSQQISFQQIKQLPVESLGDILQLQVGMTQDAGGGLHLRGGRSDEIQYIVDGVPVVDPFGGGLAVDVQNNAIQQIQVISGTFNAEYGNAMSGIVNIVTKEGGEKLEGTINAYAGQFLTSNTDLFYNISQQRPLGERYVEGTLGGPVPLFKNTTFFLSGRATDEYGWLYGRRIHNPEDIGDFTNTDPSQWMITYSGDSAVVPMNPSQSFSYSAKLTARPFENIKVTYSFTGNNGNWKNYDHFNKYNPSYEPINLNWSYNNLFSVTHVISQSTFQTLRLSYYSNRYQGYVYSDPFDPRYALGIHPNFSVPSGLFNIGGVDPGHSFTKSYTSEIKYDITSQVDKYNLVKFGVEFQDIVLEEEDYQILDNAQTHYQLAIPPLSGSQHNTYHHNPYQGAAYIQDKLEVSDIILNAGLRLDYFNSRYYVPTNLGDPSNQLKLPFSEAYRYVKPKYQLSPRIGLAFPISDKGSLHASFGEFFQMPDWNQVYTNSQFKLIPGILNSFFGNADLDAQRTTSYEIGLQQEMTDNIILNTTIYYKDIRNLLGSRDFTTFTADEYGMYVNYDYGSVYGITIALDLLKTGIISSSFDYTYQVAEGDASDPQQTFFDASSGVESVKNLIPLNWDQRNVLNWTLTISGDSWGFTTISHYATGTPIGNPITPILLNGNVQLRNQARLLPQFNIDLQAYKNFPISQDINLQLFMKVYNLFDQTLPEYFPVLRPDQLQAHQAEDYLNSLYEISFNPASQPRPRLVDIGLQLNY